MKKQKGHLIKSILPDSIAMELEIEPGDMLISINNTEIEDVLDYQYILIHKCPGEDSQGN